MTALIHDSPNYASAQPRLSVLIPFLRDDPTDLITRLDSEASALNGDTEVVLLDDGTCDPAFSQRLMAQIDVARLPIRLISLDQNQGRSQGRNLLSKNARGDDFLFLDSDMRPDRPDFLQAWTAVTRTGECAVAFGGFSLLQAPDEPRFAVHRAMAERSDCLDAAERKLHPEKYVFTSNLLINRQIFESESFDPRFTGWGWEDVEWAMRVSRNHRVDHFDIPATHMGLDTVEALVSKYEQSAPNFARVLKLHPDFVTAYPSYRVAKMLKPVPGKGPLRALIRKCAKINFLPVGLRAFCLRLYRAALYAEVV